MKPKAEATFVRNHGGAWHYEFYLNKKLYTSSIRYLTEDDAYHGMRIHVENLGGIIHRSV